VSVHFHHCPHCYEAHPCALNCTICPDLEDRGRDFGSHAICADVICHIDRAIKKHNERLDQRKREALRRLVTPDRSTLGFGEYVDQSMSAHDYVESPILGVGEYIDPPMRWMMNDVTKDEA
jgi:hypothetical protein